MNNKKIRIAFIKFGGLATGGTERGLQTLAVNLPQDKFDITYFYCDSAPYIGSDYIHPTTDPARELYMRTKGSHVKLVKFHVGQKNITVPSHTWVNTNFWDVFKEEDFDIVQTARAGHPEYPFVHIKHTPIVDLITLPGMADTQSNIAKSVHISNYQKESWVKAGGPEHIATVIPLLTEFPRPAKPVEDKPNNRKFFKGKKIKTVFGMHQRPDDGIYSSIPLDAYAMIETDNTGFVIMGGSKLYQKQAKDLRLKNFEHVPESGDYEDILGFLENIDVFAHGRADGETYGMVIAEALYCGLPIISHTAPAMGHWETMGRTGAMTTEVGGYAKAMSNFQDAKFVSETFGERIKDQAKELSLESNIQKWVDVYEEVWANNKPLESSVETNAWLKEWIG